MSEGTQAAKSLKAWRKKHSLTKAAAADKFSVTATFISLLESGQRHASPSLAAVMSKETGYPMTNFMNMKAR